MGNPWLKVPLTDYEGHMALPGIGQTQLLADILAGAIERFSPQSVAVLGCAGGNGFERIPPNVFRVVGVDLNPRYVAEVETRFRGRLNGLELIAGDIQGKEVSFAPVDLVFAGLVMEYVDVGIVMAKIGTLLTTPGHLVSVLQLPSAEHAPVSPSPFSSVQAVGEIMRLVVPAQLQDVAESRGLVLIDSRTVTSVAGKKFQVQAFTKTPSPP
jgi:predicted TPR repeat methyltransferase